MTAELDIAQRRQAEQSVESVALTRRRFRVAINPAHPDYDGQSERLVYGFVSPSGVFGIDRRDEIERDLRERGLIEDADQLWVVNHVPTGMRLGFHLSLKAASRNVDHLEHLADDMDRGEFGQDGKDIFDEYTREKLALAAMFAEHAAELEFSAPEES